MITRFCQSTKKRMRHSKLFFPLLSGLLMQIFCQQSWAVEQSLDQTINKVVGPWTERIFQVIFFKPITIGGQDIPFILIWLAGAGIFLTIYFRFINLRSLALAFRTVRGNYCGALSHGWLR